MFLDMGIHGVCFLVGRVWCFRVLVLVMSLVKDAPTPFSRVSVPSPDAFRLRSRGPCLGFLVTSALGD